MKVAILGAGVAGLSAGLTLEKHGVIPDIYEQNSFIADHYSHVGVLFDMAYRSITPKPISYLSKLLSLELSPLEKITNLIIHSKNYKAKISEQTIGYSFIMGQEPISIGNQLLNNIKKSRILYEHRESIEALRKRYDYVIAATGSRSEDYIADKYLKNWHQYLVAYTRVAKLYGKFEPNTAVVWGNKQSLKNGYGFLAPFSPQVASLYVTIPHLRDWEEFNVYWKRFLQEEQLLETTTLLGTFERTHVAADSSTKQWENCLFIGDQGGFLDPFLGLGIATAVSTGVMAARAIVNNKDYDKLVNKYQKVINMMSSFRNFYDSIDDDTFDSIVRSEENPFLNTIIYGTNIDWFKYGSFAVSPFFEQHKSPNLHETHSTPI